MATTEPKPDQERELLHKAIECYLSTIVSFANCIADICPEIGVPFRNQWRRLPQRIGFDSTPETLEKSRRSFERSLESLRHLALAYFGEGLPALRQIGEAGGQAVDLVLERNASYSVMMTTLADSLAATADLDAPPALRDQLEQHAAGLRAAAIRVEREIIPTLAGLQKPVQICEDLINRIQETSVVDLETGALSAQGFLRELGYCPATGACMRGFGGPDRGGWFRQILWTHRNSNTWARHWWSVSWSNFAPWIASAVWAWRDTRSCLPELQTRREAASRILPEASPASIRARTGKIKVKAELKVLEVDSASPVEALVEGKLEPVAQA